MGLQDHLSREHSSHSRQSEWNGSIHSIVVESAFLSRIVLRTAILKCSFVKTLHVVLLTLQACIGVFWYHSSTRLAPHHEYVRQILPRQRSFLRMFSTSFFRKWKHVPQHVCSSGTWRLPIVLQLCQGCSFEKKLLAATKHALLWYRSNANDLLFIER